MVASLLVVGCLVVRPAALGARRPVMRGVAPRPPVARETLALALSPVGMWVPVRSWGSSSPAAGVVCAPRARRVAGLPL